MIQLKGTYLFMKLAHRFPVCRSKDVGPNHSMPAYLDFEECIDIYIIEYHKPAPPVPTGVHVLVRIHRLAQAMDDKGRERKSLGSYFFVKVEGLPRRRDIHIKQAMNRVLASPDLATIHHQPTDLGEWKDLVALLVFGHCPLSYFLLNAAHGLANPVLRPNGFS